MSSLNALSTEETTKRMNANLKAKWVAALRSGEYKQGREALRDSCGGYCCLGVLHKVITGKEPGKSWDDTKPPAVKFIYGYRNKEKRARMETIQNELVLMNDDACKSFGQIADWIEANL